jgi:hypothetical protein
MIDINHKIHEFDRRWNINEGLSYEEEFRLFKQRILNIFGGISDYASESDNEYFCNFLGIQHYLQVGNDVSISMMLHQEDNEKKFYRLLELIFSLPYVGNIVSYYNKVVVAISFSKVNLAVTKNQDNEVIFYPKGEKRLDKHLVNDVLNSLDPKSNEHFADALKYYTKGSKNDRIKSAEQLRRSLEEFLKFKLRNNDGLASNIKKLGVVLKKNQKDLIIRNIIFQIFNYLDQYFNENSKHKDGDIDEPENEYLIYQTGLILRYVNKAIN